MSKFSSGPAFPIRRKLDNGAVVFSDGMTLRDYFAAQAMAAIISKIEPKTAGRNEDTRVQQVAVGAYWYADAMLAEREK